MDPNDYRQVRELFHVAGNLKDAEQADYLRQVEEQHSGVIYHELISLLSEHDADFARDEGSNPNAYRYIVPAEITDPTIENEDGGAISKIKTSPPTRSLIGDATGGESSQIASSFLLESQTRKSRRRNNAWLWITALLPTAFIGWMTYAEVNSTMKQAVRDELRGVSDSVSHAVRRFLSDKAHLVESWTREPAIQNEIHQLVQMDPNQSDGEQKNRSRDVIARQLERLSGIIGLKFAIWGAENGHLITNYSETASKFIRDERDIQSMIRRAEKGEVVIFGPLRIPKTNKGGVDTPEMGAMTAVRDENDQVIATILVTKIGMHQEFSRMFFDIANAGNLDAYAISETGTMLTESPRAATLSSSQRLDVIVEDIAASLRVADPGTLIVGSDQGVFPRNSFPLTRAAKSVTKGRSEVELEPYRNYAGIEVVGSWRWNSDSGVGIIIERPASQAFATVWIVRFSFILLGSLLFLSVTIAAAFLARATAAEQAAIHPLSRYEVVEEVGVGGMGLVYRTQHRQLGRETALKVMIGGTQKKEDQLRFDREARLAASLSNPHSVTIYDYGRSEDGESYCVMEFLHGLTLQEVVDHSGHQPLGRVLFILRQVCEAVAEAHQKRLLHLDIKPQNIMLSLDQAVGDWAVLFDYGLSKPIAPSLDYYRSPSAKWSGTPMYMAPERFHHLDQVDQRSDIYSLGCVAYFLTTGDTPFFDTDVESLFALIINQSPIDLTTRRREKVPDSFENLVVKCMAKSPEKRYQNIQEFVVDIEQLQAAFPWTAEDSRRWWHDHSSIDKQNRVPMT